MIIFESKIADRDRGIKHLITNVSVFYKIPLPELEKKYKISQIKEMYIDVLYYNKKNKEAMEKT